jgi:hypothetical protein
VIPCADGPRCFEDTLVSVLQNRPQNCEVLVVQPRPYDDPYDLCGEVRFVEAFTGSSVVDLLNVGVRAARSEIVHLLSCDARVESGWADAAVANFDDQHVASVSPLLTEPGNRQRVATAGIDFGIGGVMVHRRQSVEADQIKRPRTISPTLHAAFYRRQAVLDADCFRPGAGPLTHVDLALRLRSSGWRHVVESHSQVKLGRRCKHPLSVASGKRQERLFWQHAASRGRIRSLIAHPAAVAAETLRYLYRPGISMQLLGRVLAFLEIMRGNGLDDRSDPATVLKYEPTDRTDSAKKRRRRAA